MTTCMCDVAPPKSPIKVAIWAKSGSQSLALKLSTLPRSLAVTFPWLHFMCHPCRTTYYISSLSFLCYIMCVFSTVCICAMPYCCTRMEPPLPPLTSDATPIRSKVALQLTASQGIDYHSMVSTVKPCEHQERDCCNTVNRTSVDTMYIIITAPVPLHLASLGGSSKRIVSGWYVHSAGLRNLISHALVCYF